MTLEGIPLSDKKKERKMSLDLVRALRKDLRGPPGNSEPIEGERRECTQSSRKKRRAETRKSASPK